VPGFTSKLGLLSLGRFKLGDAELTTPPAQDLVLGFIGSATVVYTPLLSGSIDVPFISSTTVVYAPVLEGDIDVPFITSTTVLFPPTVAHPYVLVPFLSSATTLYTPFVQSDQLAVPFLTVTPVLYPPYLQPDYIELPFIGSATVVYPPYVQPDYTEVPFIPSVTAMYRITSVWKDSTGPGNGGEGFMVQLAPASAPVTVTLASGITSTATMLTFTSPITGLLDDIPFVVHIDSEAILVRHVSVDGLTGSSCLRAQANTAAVSHSGGANVTWTEAYDMAIVSTNQIVASTLLTIGSWSQLYEGFVMVCDSSQGYLNGDRYPAHVSELLGVFPPEDTTSRLDGPQPSSVSVDAAVSEDCPAGITQPAKIADTIEVGDVALCRYTNIESDVLVLGPRSVIVQSWYGMIRVTDANVIVTDTDPNANIIDGTTEGSEFESEFITATLLGDDRTFTYGPPRYSNKGWPIGVIAVRQGRRRVPLWTSPTWHDFNYVYTGFGDDHTFVQVVINRNDFIWNGASPDAEVDLPGPQDIDGPDITWDDTALYYTSTCWYVALFGFESHFVAGPPIGTITPPPPTIIPVIPPGGTGGGGGPPGTGFVNPPLVPVEGGSGGDIPPTVENVLPVVGVFFEADLALAPFDGIISLD